VSGKTYFVSFRLSVIFEEIPQVRKRSCGVRKEEVIDSVKLTKPLFSPLLDPDIKKLDQKDVRQNVRRAERAHVSFDELHFKAPKFAPDDKTREEIEAGLERWKQGRTGTQIAAVRFTL